jgi:hypothetical protein
MTPSRRRRIGLGGYSRIVLRALLVGAPTVASPWVAHPRPRAPNADLLRDGLERRAGV